MKRLTHSLNRQLVLLGMPGVAGIGLLLFCLAFYFSGIRPLEINIALQRQMIAEQLPARTAPKADWRKLRASMPDMAESDLQIEKIHALAARYQVKLKEGEYQDETFKGAQLVARHLNFSAKGDYFQVRHFLSAMLTQIPTLTLDAVQFQKSGNGGALEARISLSLYVAG